MIKPKKEIRAIILGHLYGRKSTFINMIANLIANKSFRDPRNVAIPQTAYFRNYFGRDCSVKLEPNMPQSSAIKHDNDNCLFDTFGCCFYEFENESVRLTLLDTPVMENLVCNSSVQVPKLAAALKQLGSFEAIILVQPTQFLLTTGLLEDYSFSEMLGLLSKDCRDNFVVCYIGVDHPSQITSMGQLELLGPALKNSYCFADAKLAPMEAVKEEFFGGGTEYEFYAQTAAQYWRHNMNSFEAMLAAVGSFQTRDSKEILEVIERRQMLEATLKELVKLEERGKADSKMLQLARDANRWILERSMHPVNQYLECFILRTELKPSNTESVFNDLLNDFIGKRQSEITQNYQRTKKVRDSL
jgi:hypothetical protein